MRTQGRTTTTWRLTVDLTSRLCCRLLRPACCLFAQLFPVPAGCVEALSAPPVNVESGDLLLCSCKRALHQLLPLCPGAVHVLQARTSKAPTPAPTA